MCYEGNERAVRENSRGDLLEFGEPRKASLGTGYLAWDWKDEEEPGLQKAGVRVFCVESPGHAEARRQGKCDMAGTWSATGKCGRREGWGSSLEGMDGEKHAFRVSTMCSSEGDTYRSRSVGSLFESSSFCMENGPAGC